MTSHARHPLSLTRPRACPQLAATGAARAAARGWRPQADLLAAIHRMQVLQIDTIHVVAQPVSGALEPVGRLSGSGSTNCWPKGRLFEYWAHAACFLPIEHYRLPAPDAASRSRRHAPQRRRLPPTRWGISSAFGIGARAGPCGGRFRTRRRPQRHRMVGLEAGQTAHRNAVFAGEIMVARRERFHRIYDVRERVLPSSLLDDGAVPSREKWIAPGRWSPSRRSRAYMPRHGALDWRLLSPCPQNAAEAASGWLVDQWRADPERSRLAQPAYVIVTARVAAHAARETAGDPLHPAIAV